MFWVIVLLWDKIRSNQMLSTWYSMVQPNGVIAFFVQHAFYFVQIPHFPSTKAPQHPQSITLPPPCLTDGIKYSSSIFSGDLHLTKLILCEPNTPIWDVSVYSTFLQSSFIQFLCSHLYNILSFLGGSCMLYRKKLKFDLTLQFLYVNYGKALLLVVES